MVIVKVDEKKNILVLECVGYIPTNEALTAAILFDQEIKKLKPEFVVLSNIKNLTSSTRQARIILQFAMRKIETLSPKKIIRVVKNYNGALFFDRAEQTAKIEYLIHRVNSEKEASYLLS